MTWIWILMFAALAAAMIYSWQRGRHPGAAPTARPGMEQGELMLTGITERPLDADKDGKAFCTISGQITGPTTAPTHVYRQLVLDFKAPWPQLNDRLPVYYKTGKVDSSWQIGVLSPPTAPDFGHDQYPE